MREEYFRQGYVDSDDKFHRKAVELNVVPETCLLGGSLLMSAAEKGLDPCVVACPTSWPRKICGGRAPSKNLDLAMKSSNKGVAERGLEGSAAARRLGYKPWIEKIDAETKD